jgi:hypothetical protein
VDDESRDANTWQFSSKVSRGHRSAAVDDGLHRRTQHHHPDPVLHLWRRCGGEERWPVVFKPFRVVAQEHLPHGLESLGWNPSRIVLCVRRERTRRRSDEYETCDARCTVPRVIADHFAGRHRHADECHTTQIEAVEGLSCVPPHSAITSDVMLPRCHSAAFSEATAPYRRAGRVSGGAARGFRGGVRDRA